MTKLGNQKCIFQVAWAKAIMHAGNFLENKILSGKKQTENKKQLFLSI